MKIQLMKLEDIIPYDNNPRDNDKAVEVVANSIKSFGARQHIVVDKNNVIIVGHTRLLAAKKLGMKEFPVEIADDLSDEKARAYRIADNASNDVSDWDIEKLTQEMNAMPDVNFLDFGLDMDAEMAKLQGLIVDDDSDKSEGRKQVNVKDDEIIIKIKDMDIKQDIVDVVKEAVDGFGQYADMVYTMGDE